MTKTMTSNQIERMFNNESRDKKRMGYGAHNMTSSGGSSRGKSIKVANFAGTKEDNKPKQMKMTKNGITKLVPGEWFTLKGMVRKNKMKQLDALFTKEVR